MTVYAITDTKKGRTGIAPTYLHTTHGCYVAHTMPSTSPAWRISVNQLSKTDIYGGALCCKQIRCCTAQRPPTTNVIYLVGHPQSSRRLRMTIQLFRHFLCP